MRDLAIVYFRSKVARNQVANTYPGKCEQDAADVNGEGEHCKHTQELAVRMFL